MGGLHRNGNQRYFCSFPSDHNADGEKIAPLCQRGDLQPDDGSTTTTTILSTTATTQELTTTTAEECPEGWSRNQTSCYWVVFDQVDWVEANDGCHQLHSSAHLASSGSALENDFIGHLHRVSQSYLLWLGGTDSGDEGNWAWTDGSTFNYTRWHSGDGDGDIAQNCLALDTYPDNQFYWYDLECFESHSYVCEINLGSEKR